MKISATDQTGTIHILGDILSLEIDARLDVPADTLSLTAALTKTVPEFVSVKAEEGTTVIFTGLVDEQRISVSSPGGSRLTLRARSMAALLLDNECPPGIYAGPLFSDLFGRFARPLGITSFSFADKRLSGQFTIEKGESVWQVLERAALATLGRRLRIDETGRLCALSPSAKSYTFGPAGQACLSAEMVTRRHKPISEVVTVDEHTQSYSLNFLNYGLIPRKISRRRYVRFFGQTAAQKAASAAAYMKQSGNNTRVYELKIPGIVRFDFGAQASVSCGIISAAGLRVCRLSHIAGKDGAYTIASLWPNDDIF